MYLWIEDGRDELERSKTVFISIRISLEVWTQRNIVKKQNKIKKREK